MICISIIPLNIVGQTPIDATQPFAQVLYTSTPQTNPYGVAWFQSVTLQNNHFPNNGYILVDTIKLIEEDIATGNETVLSIENYNGSGALTLNEGGLYERFSYWFADSGSYIPMINSSRNGGLLTINVGTQPDKINHFWGVRQLCTIGKRHKVEISVLISGDIALQAGMDYWTNLTSTSSSDDKEAFYSKWYGDSNGQYITIKFPGYGKFDRSDYGFYTNGKFYLSKKLVDFVGGSSVGLLCDATGWQPAIMILNGNFYEYDTKSSINIDMSYCFKINPDGNSRYVPHLVINNLANPSDAVDNGYGGYNFHTSPQTAVNISEITSESKLCIYPNPSSDYIYIKSLTNINNIQVYDCKGNGIVTKCEPDISSINITNLPNGMYFLKLETKNGIVFRKFIKE